MKAKPREGGGLETEAEEEEPGPQAEFMERTIRDDISLGWEPEVLQEAENLGSNIGIAAAGHAEQLSHVDTLGKGLHEMSEINLWDEQEALPRC